jgi:hypothetical protein
LLRNCTSACLRRRSPRSHCGPGRPSAIPKFMPLIQVFSVIHMQISRCHTGTGQVGASSPFQVRKCQPATGPTVAHPQTTRPFAMQTEMQRYEVQCELLQGFANHKRKRSKPMQLVSDISFAKDSDSNLEKEHSSDTRGEPEHVPKHRRSVSTSSNSTIRDDQYVYFFSRLPVFAMAPP